MNRQNAIRRFDIKLAINAPCPRFIVIAMASPRDEYLTDTSETELKSITLPLEKDESNIVIHSPARNFENRQIC